MESDTPAEPQPLPAAVLYQLRKQENDLAILMAILDEVAGIFDFYANSHRAKGTPDGDRKAATNDTIAADLRTMLHVMGFRPDNCDCTVGPPCRCHPGHIAGNPNRTNDDMRFEYVRRYYPHVRPTGADASAPPQDGEAREGQCHGAVASGDGVGAAGA